MYIYLTCIKVAVKQKRNTRLSSAIMRYSKVQLLEQPSKPLYQPLLLSIQLLQIPESKKSLPRLCDIQIYGTEWQLINNMHTHPQ